MNAFVFTSPSHVHLFMLILLINQIYNHFHHDILFLGAALGNHQGEGNEGVVGTRIKSLFSKKKCHFATCPVFIGVRAVALWWH